VTRVEIAIPRWIDVPRPAAEGPPWPESLEGKTIGLLDNGKPGAARVLDAIYEELRVGLSRVDVVRARKPHPSKGMTDAERRDLARSHVIVTGLGD
jgi:hypothetical protein